MKLVATLSIGALVSVVMLTSVMIMRMEGQEVVNAKLLVGEWVGQWRHTQGQGPRQAMGGQYSLTITALDGSKVSGTWHSSGLRGENEGKFVGRLDGNKLSFGKSEKGGEVVLTVSANEMQGTRRTAQVEWAIKLVKK